VAVVVVVVVGHWVHSLDRDKKTQKGKTHFFVVVSISGVVGTVIVIIQAWGGGRWTWGEHDM
jgi:hypothetical protein